MEETQRVEGKIFVSSRVRDFDQISGSGNSYFRDAMFLPPNPDPKRG